MPSIANLARWEGWILLGGFAAIVGWKIFTGEISLSYLLEGDVRDPAGPDGFTTQASTGRAQALAVTLLVAGYYVMQVVRNPRELPQIPTQFVAALGLSHALYLGGKVQDMLSK